MTYENPLTQLLCGLNGHGASIGVRLTVHGDACGDH